MRNRSIDQQVRTVRRAANDEVVEKVAAVLGTDEREARLVRPLPKGGSVIVLTAADRRQLEVQLFELAKMIRYVGHTLDRDHNVSRDLRRDIRALVEQAKSLDMVRALLRAVPDEGDQPRRGGR